MKIFMLTEGSRTFSFLWLRLYRGVGAAFSFVSPLFSWHSYVKIRNHSTLTLIMFFFGERTHLFQPTLDSWSVGGASRSQLEYRLYSSSSLFYRHPSSQCGSTHGARVVQVSHVLFTVLSLPLATPSSPAWSRFLLFIPL